MDCWGDVSTPAEHLAKSQVDPGDVPAVGGRALRRRSSSPTTYGILAGPLPADRAQAGRAAPVRAPGARHGRRGRPQRPDHRAGLEQRRQGRRDLPAGILERGDGPFDRDLDAGDVRALLGLRAVRHRLDERAAAAAAAARARTCSVPAGQFPPSPTASSNGFDNPPDFYDWFMDPDEGRRVPRRGRSRVSVETPIPPLLAELLLAHGASGYEDAVQAIVRREAAALGAEIEQRRARNDDRDGEGHGRRSHPGAVHTCRSGWDGGARRRRGRAPHDRSAREVAARRRGAAARPDHNGVG